MRGMESLAVLAALIVLAIPVTLVVLIVAFGRLRHRVSGLEAEIRVLKRLVSSQVPTDAPAYVPPAATERMRPELSEPIVPVAAPPPTDASQSPMSEDFNPWSPKAAAAVPANEGPVVLTAARASALGAWLRDNWVYAVSALSLAFAGVFFVQYGVEKGLLPPAMRVTMAILFGLALVAAGEWIRRHWGDGKASATAYLPSTFSGAGLVSMFAGVLAARQLYGLIGVEAAFAGLVAVAGLAVVLGWFYGPFLAAVGLLGAAAAPFVVGGSSEAAYWLYGYFALITGAGLAVDAVRRWAWVSVLALVLGYAGGWLVLQGTGGEGWFALLLAGLALLSVTVPALRLQPDHDGPLLAEALASRGKSGWPIFPTRLAAGSIILSTLGLTVLGAAVPSESVMAYVCLTLLASVLMFWSHRARALADLAFVPAAGFLIRLGFEGLGQWPLAWEYSQNAVVLRAAETAAPLTASLLLAAATVLTLIAAWRSGDAPYRAFWAAGAALVAPMAAMVLELFWRPSEVLGAYPWALHVIALAALMGFLAGRFASQDATDHRRAAYAVLSTLSLIALALFLITTKGALTLALAALVAVAAALDRRFRLPEMGFFIQAAVVVLSYRLVIDPGLIWAIDKAQTWEVLASYGGAAAGMVAGLWLLNDLGRRGAKVLLESAAAAYAALLANVIITRWLTDGRSEDWVLSHWALTLNAMPWLILTLAQLYRLQLGGAMRWVHRGIAAVAGVLAIGGIGAAALVANPLFGLAYGGAEGLVYGPYVFDTLLVAYGLPAALLLATLTRLSHLNRWFRIVLTVIGTALAALYAALEIRRFWRGDDLSVAGVTQPELYSYTIALMVVGAVLLYQAIARRAPGLRRAAMAVIALTVAKVFLIDASGLSGLTRVFSFLVLGLSLAGLAWLNRWAAERGEGQAQGQG